MQTTINDSDVVAPPKKRRFRPSEATKRRARMVRAYINLGISQLALGSGGILARFAMAGMSIYAVGALRLGMVGSLLLARMAYLRRPWLKRRDELLLFATGVLLAQQCITWMQSIAYLTVGTATLLYCTAPLWNGMYEVLFLKRKLPLRFWLAILAAGIGMGLMVWEPSDAASSAGDEHKLLGMALALSSGVGIAAHLIVMRKLSKRGDEKSGYGTLDLLARSYSYAALVMAAFAFADGTPLAPLSDWKSWGGVIGMGVLAQGVGHTLQNGALKHVRASIVGFSTLLEPIIAAALGVVIFDEAITVLNGVGAVIVLAALGWALVSTQQAEVATATDGPLAEGTNNPPPY